MNKSYNPILILGSLKHLALGSYSLSDKKNPKKKIFQQLKKLEDQGFLTITERHARN